MQASEWLNPGAIDGSERRCNDAFRQPSKAQAVLYTLHARPCRQRENKAHQSGQRMQPFRDSRLIDPVGFDHHNSSNDDVGYAFDTYRCVGHV